VRVQGRPEVLHDVLADDVVEIALANADQARDDRQPDHQADEQVELPPVPVRDRVVDEELEENRVDEADEARGKDRDEDDPHLEAIGSEERDDPAQGPAASLPGDRWTRIAAPEAAPGAAAARRSTAPTDASAAAAAPAADAGTRRGPQSAESAAPSAHARRRGWRPAGRTVCSIRRTVAPNVGNRAGCHGGGEIRRQRFLSAMRVAASRRALPCSAPSGSGLPRSR
jgi:hypothetical protein